MCNYDIRAEKTDKCAHNILKVQNNYLKDKRF